MFKSLALISEQRDLSETSLLENKDGCYDWEVDNCGGHTSVIPSVSGCPGLLVVRFADDVAEKKYTALI